MQAEILILFIFSFAQARGQILSSSQDVTNAASAALGLQDAMEDITDLGVYGKYVEGQWFHANINDTLPTFPYSFLRVGPLNDFYRLRRCERADVAKCVNYGNSSNGLPKQLHGIWWQDGVALPEEAISPAAVWDPKLRRLSIRAYAPNSWAAPDTDSVKAPSGLYWLPSGAAHMNFLATFTGIADIFFNEDITVGQIVASTELFGFLPFAIPTFFINWTMTLEPDGSWLRTSYTAGINTKSGNYHLRSIVTGEGKPGPYFEGWKKFRGGRPFVYVEKA